MCYGSKTSIQMKIWSMMTKRCSSKTSAGLMRIYKLTTLMLVRLKLKQRQITSTKLSRRKAWTTI